MLGPAGFPSTRCANLQHSGGKPSSWVPQETPTFSPPAVHRHGEGFPFHIATEGVPPSPLKRYGGDMHWLGRPPYLKWAAVTILVIVAFAWDASERATEPFPFAARTIARGQVLEPDDIEWRDVPSGTLSLPGLTEVSAAVAIVAGDPIVPSLLAPKSSLPRGWWAVPMALPLGTTQGMRVRLVFVDGTSVEGTVVQPAEEDSLGLASDGLVAVDGVSADAVALAAANGDLVVLFEP